MRDAASGRIVALLPRRGSFVDPGKTRSPLDSTHGRHIASKMLQPAPHFSPAAATQSSVDGAGDRGMGAKAVTFRPIRVFREVGAEPTAVCPGRRPVESPAGS